MLIKNGEYILNSEQDSINLAVQIANNIKPGDILTFTGDLGSGKSFLCRHIIKELCGGRYKRYQPDI
jgi:tRNA threonylcarbamoyladenosine biosynthesis protein TsaE